MASPLVQWTLGYLLGVLLADALRPSPLVLCCLSIFAWLLLVASAVRRELSPRGLFLVAVLLGGWVQAGSLRPTPYPAALAAELAGSGGEVWLLQGMVRETLGSSAEGIAVALDVTGLGRLETAMGRPPTEDSSHWWQAEPALPVELFVEGRPAYELLPGDALRVAAVLRLPPRSGGATAGLPLAHSAGLRAYAHPDGLLPLQPAPAPLFVGLWRLGPRRSLLRWAAKARSALRQAHDAAWLALPRRLRSSGASEAATAPLQLAMSLGDRGPLRWVDMRRSASRLPPVEALLRDAGVYHILSVSGLHLSAVGLTFYALSRWAARRLWGALPPIARLAPGGGGRWAALLTLPVVVAYALLTGAESPTVRAAIALGAALLAIGVGRRARLSTGLALAALWTALPFGSLAEPLGLFSPSLLLSFAATLGIAYLRPIASLGASLSPGGLRPGGLAGRALRWLLRLADASLAAVLATAPLLAYYFAEFQGAAPLGNLLVTPLAEFVLLPAGLLSSLLALIWPPLALPLIVCSALVGRLLLWLAGLVAGLGLGCAVAAPSRWLILLWGLGLCLWSFRPRWGVAVVTTALVLYLLLWRWPPGTLRVSFVDVGQGDAAVAELPGGGVVVIDTGWSVAAGRGSRAMSRSGECEQSGPTLSRTLLGQFLARRGHRRIDLLIITHRHPDHMSGAASLLCQFAVDTLWLNRWPPSTPSGLGHDELSQAEASLRALAWARGTQVAVPHSLRLSGVALDVLSPCPEPAPCRATARLDWEENDNSLVVALRYAGRTILLTGDIEAAAEQALLASGAILRADVLKLPHHGSRTSSSQALLTAVAPGLAIASLGRQNRFGFPHPQVLDRLREGGIPLLRTDRDGTIQIEIAGDGQLQRSLGLEPATFLRYLGLR